MLVFIDESGDAGLRIADGSTDYFVVILVAFRDYAEADKADNSINLLRRKLGLPSSFEFHFNSLNNRRREAFLDTLASQEFFYSGIVIDKRKLDGTNMQHGADSFHQYVCGLVFQNMKSYLYNSIVVIDGTGTRTFRRALQTYLRKCTNDRGTQHIKQVRMQQSRTNNLLQLADMICGAVRRSYGKKRDSQIYRQLISRREIGLQVWPK